VISPSQRPLPDNTQHSQETDIHALGGIRTHKTSKRAAADRRPNGHWDWQGNINCSKTFYVLKDGEFLDQLGNYQLLKNEYFMLVISLLNRKFGLAASLNLQHSFIRTTVLIRRALLHGFALDQSGPQASVGKRIVPMGPVIWVDCTQ
jgi:hypothetical protein